MTRYKLTDLPALQAQLAGASPQDVLAFGLERFGDRLILASSMGVEDVALIDMLARLQPGARVGVLDTGRLHQETYDTLQAVHDRYDLTIEVYTPDPAHIEPLLRRDGPNGFYRDLDARHACCHARKVEPLQRMLASADAWVTGMRRDQNVTRAHIAEVELDLLNRGILKLNPLAAWTSAQVWDYVRAHDVPYNPLHDQGFPSIGCAPCTRAVAPGADPRSGRWWWERPDERECGLHVEHAEHAEPSA